MSYTFQAVKSINELVLSHSSRVIVLPERTHDISFEDGILDHVKSAWDIILGDNSTEYDFLRFEERRDAADDEE